MADYLCDGTYELRPKDNRIFYFFHLRENIILLDGMRQKTDKIPALDLEVCLKRRKQVEDSGSIQILGIW